MAAATTPTPTRLVSCVPGQWTRIDAGTAGRLFVEAQNQTDSEVLLAIGNASTPPSGVTGWILAARDSWGPYPYGTPCAIYARPTGSVAVTLAINEAAA